MAGNYNIAIGNQAGKPTTGNNNVYISNAGTAAENGIIQIGTSPNQTAAFVAGINGANVMGVNVMVNSAGQLGVASRAATRKTCNRWVKTSERLYSLRPVQFLISSPTSTARSRCSTG